LNSDNTNISLIISKCLDKDVLAQKKLFEYRYGYVYSVCKLYSKSAAQTKEMLNDSFYTVFKNLEKYDTSLPFDPWLRRVCVNCCLQYQRKYFKNPELVELTSSHIDINEEVLPSPSQIDYISILQKLPTAYKTVLSLYAIEGFKHFEIAEKLGISVGTSKSNYHRAKKLFIKILAEEEQVKVKKGRANE
jgi:RNA polymerase sigma-70 factor (ECF subfamily)